MIQSSKRQFAVIGLGFGDEGKGSVVNYLCQRYNFESNLVVRFNGGHQAGHTVWLPDGRNHVFSNFGSGTFQGVPTFWSKFCTIDPVGIYNEYQELTQKGVKPILIIDKNCPVTTPYDKTANKTDANILDHGTCGVGFGKTLKREEKFYSLVASDLLHNSVLKLKYEAIREYYSYNNMAFDDEFFRACKFVVDNFVITQYLDHYDNIIYEGAQGLMLDQHYGFFPHVTPSNTGSKNIVALGGNPMYYTVTRAFQTRHGNGPMTNKGIEHKIKLDDKETNQYNDYQGKFKYSLLDVDLLKYALDRDPDIKLGYNLMITCMDLVKDDGYRLTCNGKVVNCGSEKVFVDTLKSSLGKKIVYTSDSKEGNFKHIK
jgi:adenylosuccinate synthase